MSCFGATILPWIAAISGLPVDRLEQMVDTARRKPLPPLPLDPEVADAVLAGFPAAHDPKQGAAVLQAVAQGLRLALRQSRDRPPAARDLALLTALTGTILPDISPPDPSFVQAMRDDLRLRPTPLPLALPDDPDARRRAVLAAARVGSWTDDEVERIASDPALAGLAWALGVRHPRIRAVVEQSLDAAVAALRAGATDSDLLRRVAMDDTPQWAVEEVLTTSTHTAPVLIAAAARDVYTAAQVLTKRKDITAPVLIAKAAEWRWSAAWVLASRPDLTEPKLITIAAQEADTAACVLGVRQDLRDPALIAAAAQIPWTAAEVLVARPDITDHRLIAAAAREPKTAAEVLVARPDITDHRLIAAAAREPKTAAEVLVARPDITDHRLIAAAASHPAVATHIATSCSHRGDRHDDI